MDTFYSISKYINKRKYNVLNITFSNILYDAAFSINTDVHTKGDKRILILENLFQWNILEIKKRISDQFKIQKTWKIHQWIVQNKFTLHLTFPKLFLTT